MSPEIDALNATNYPAVTPMLTVSDVNASVEFYTKAFGFSVRGLLKDDHGQPIHAELVLRGSVLMLTPEIKKAGAVDIKSLAGATTKLPEAKLRGGHTAKSLGGSPTAIHLSVPDVDSVSKRAISLGATPWGDVETMFWGDRRQHIIDHDGYDWEIATHIADVTKKDFSKDSMVLNLHQDF